MIRRVFPPSARLRNAFSRFFFGQLEREIIYGHGLHTVFSVSVNTRSVYAKDACIVSVANITILEYSAMIITRAIANEGVIFTIEIVGSGLAKLALPIHSCRSVVVLKSFV